MMAPIDIDSDDFDIHSLKDKLEKSFFYTVGKTKKPTKNSLLLISKTIFFILKDKYPYFAVKYGEKALEISHNSTIRRYLANTYFRAGQISKSLFYFNMDKKK